MPSAIHNVYTLEQQWERMWTGRTLEQELKHCEHRELRTHLLEVLGQMKDPFVVEAGCGVGAWVAYLSRNGIRRVVGVDNYAPALEELKRHMPAGLVMEADVRDLPFTDDSVDVCISLGVVEHFPDGPTPLILEMFRVLRPGGYLFLTVPYYNLFRRLFIHPLRAAYLSVKSRIRKRGLHFVEYRFTRTEIAKIVEGCGFQLVRVTTDDYEPTSGKKACFCKYGRTPHSRRGCVMQILFLSAHLPSPHARQGGQRTSYHICEFLGLRHDMHLLCFGTENERAVFDGQGMEIFHSWDVVPVSQWTRLRGVLSSTRLPLSAAARYSRTFRFVSASCTTY